MRTAYIGMIIALMIIFVTPSQSIMRFSYTCDGTDATATTYSYLREPRISEQGYSIGLKSGSFNYLKNGNMTIREDIDYYYGNGTNISNSTEIIPLKSISREKRVYLNSSLGDFLIIIVGYLPGRR